MLVCKKGILHLAHWTVEVIEQYFPNRVSVPPLVALVFITSLFVCVDITQGCQSNGSETQPSYYYSLHRNFPWLSMPLMNKIQAPFNHILVSSSSDGSLRVHLVGPISVHHSTWQLSFLSANSFWVPTSPGFVQRLYVFEKLFLHPIYLTSS